SPDPMTTLGRSVSWSGLRPASYRSSLAARCAHARREPNLGWRQHRNPLSQQGYLIAAKGILCVNDLAGDGYAWAADGLEWGGLSALACRPASGAYRPTPPDARVGRSYPFSDHDSQSGLLNFSRKISTRSAPLCEWTSRAFWGTRRKSPGRSIRTRR